jgi:hypothetical protein
MTLHKLIGLKLVIFSGEAFLGIKAIRVLLMEASNLHVSKK